MVYALRDLIADCVNGRGRVKATKEKRRGVYDQVWLAVNRWILESFSKGKTIHVPSFARIGWEVVEAFDRGTGGTGFRQQPLFVPTDHFLRSNGLPVKKVAQAPFFSHVDEVNFIKLAIKYSEDLTKDHVFSGLRDIMQRLGRVVASGEKVEINMSIGKFYSNERKMAFWFDKNVCEAVLRRVPLDDAVVRQFREERAAGTGSAARGDTSFDSAGGLAEPEEKPETSARSRPSTRPHIPELTLGAGIGGGPAEKPKEKPKERRTLDAGGSPTNQFYKDLDTLDDYEAFSDDGASFDGGSTFEDITAASTLVKGGLPGVSDKQWTYLAAHNSKNPVLEEAYARNEHTTIEDAEADLAEAQVNDDLFWEEELQLRAARRAEAEERKQLQSYIQKQIKDTNARKEAEAEELRTAGMTVDPETGEVTLNNGAIVDGPTMYDMKRERSDSWFRARDELNQGLKAQVEERETMAAEEFSRDRVVEKAYIEHVQKELEEEAEFRRMQRKIVTHDLTKAWERDKSLKAAINERVQAATKKRGMVATTRVLSIDPPPPRYSHGEGKAAAAVLGYSVPPTGRSRAGTSSGRRPGSRRSAGAGSGSRRMSRSGSGGGVGGGTAVVGMPPIGKPVGPAVHMPRVDSARPRTGFSGSARHTPLGGGFSGSATRDPMSARFGSARPQSSLASRR